MSGESSERSVCMHMICVYTNCSPRPQMCLQILSNICAHILCPFVPTHNTHTLHFFVKTLRHNRQVPQDAQSIQRTHIHWKHTRTPAVQVETHIHVAYMTHNAATKPYSRHIGSRNHVVKNVLSGKETLTHNSCLIAAISLRGHTCQMCAL